MQRTYLLCIRERDDTLKRLWFTSAYVENIDGAKTLRFKVSADPSKALRVPGSLAQALAEICSDEGSIVELVRPAAVELARVMAAAVE